MRKTSTAIAFALAGVMTAPAAAQDGHDLYHSLYEAWQRPDGKGSCCNNFDCRPVVYRDGANGVEIRVQELGNSWHQVPNQTVLPFGSFNAEAHACYALVGCRTAQGCRPHFFCVVLPMAM
jgi:hypothetical protein